MKKILIATIGLLVLIASCSKKTSAPSSPIDAASLFSGNCARCHGADGASGRAPNLAKLEMSTDEISGIISNGSGKMPQFSDKLSAQEISALTQFVVKLKK